MDQANRVGSQLAQILVLNEIGDDYEHFARIRRGVLAMTERMARTITTKEISDAILEVIRSGLAKAYYLSPWGPPQEVAPDVVVSRMEELCGTCDEGTSSKVQEENQMSPHEDAYEPGKLYFIATQKGLTALAAFDEWPAGVER